MERLSQPIEHVITKEVQQDATLVVGPLVYQSSTRGFVYKPAKRLGAARRDAALASMQTTAAEREAELRAEMFKSHLPGLTRSECRLLGLSPELAAPPPPRSPPRRLKATD